MTAHSSDQIEGRTPSNLGKRLLLSSETCGIIIIKLKENFNFFFPPFREIEYLTSAEF